MDLHAARECLGLSEKYTDDDLRKSYYKLSLKYHPDRAGEEGKLEFQKINEAHSILLEDRGFKHEIVNLNSLDSLMDKIIKNKKIDVNVIIDIWNTLPSEGGRSENSLQQIIINMDYFKKIFVDDLDILSYINDLLINKKPIIYILEVSIHNLINADIYKFKYLDHDLCIPLWFPEISFNIDNKELVFKTHLQKPNFLRIDENNELFINIKLSYKTICEYLFQNNQDYIDIKIDKINIPLYFNEISIQKQQIIKKKNIGIPKINLDNIYDHKISSTYINLELTY